MWVILRRACIPPRPLDRRQQGEVSDCPTAGICHRPAITLDAKIPDGPIEQKWEKHKFDMQLVNPANKRRYTIIVIAIWAYLRQAGVQL